MTERILVLGGGGHSKIVVSTLDSAGRRPYQVLDDDTSKWDSDVLGVPISGPIARAADEPADVAIAAFGSNRLRAEVTSRFELDWTPVVHPTAHVHPSATIGPGSIVAAGAIVQPDCIVGAHSIINTGASVDHDCVLGEFTHVAPGARLAGAVRVGAGTLIGIGAAVVPGVVIGEWVKVGAGAAVTGDLPAHCIAVGVPAQPIEVGP